MTIFTQASLLAFITAHNCVPPEAARLMDGVAAWESGRNSSAVHTNPKGSRDWGIAQINDVNLAWTGLTPETAMDPCRNLAAGLKVLLAKYNGNPPDVGKIAYANGVLSKIAEARPEAATATEVPPVDRRVAECAAPPWDTWGQQACRAHSDNPPEDKKGEQK